jgi:hypothetical protein
MGISCVQSGEDARLSNDPLVGLRKQAQIDGTKISACALCCSNLRSPRTIRLSG